MDNVIKKAMLLGLGITTMTKEALETAVKELTDKGEVNAKEGKKMVQDLLKKSKKQNEMLAKKINQQIQKALKPLNLATKKDIDTLKARISKIEKKQATKK